MNRLYAVLILLVCMVFHVNAISKCRVKSIHITYGLYGEPGLSSYGISVFNSNYVLAKDSFILENSVRWRGRLYSTPPYSMPVAGVEKLISTINEHSQKDTKNLIPLFTKDDVAKCVSEITTWEDIEEMLYHISKEECLKILEAKDVTHYVELRDKVYLEDYKFKILIQYDNGESLSLKSSAYKDDYWVVNNESYVKDEYITPIIDQLNLSAINQRSFGKDDMLLQIIVQCFGTRTRGRGQSTSPEVHEN